jgi:peptidoglycan/LPS O-acetylase OafA/YrhL
MRGIAIGLILIYHYFLLPISPHVGTALYYVQASGRLAWTGVDLFFVLSGFLIGGILLEARESANYFQVFYRRRFWRIVPLYASCLCVIFVLTKSIASVIIPRFQWPGLNRTPWYAYALFLQNFWMAKQNTLGAFGLAVTWSLAIEEQFYLTLPLVIRLFKKHGRTLLITIGVILAPVLRILLFHYWPSKRFATFVLMPCRADALLLGVLGATMLRTDKYKQWLEQNGRVLRLVLVCLVSGAALLNYFYTDMHSLLMISVGYTWMAFLYLCAILYAVTHRQSWLSNCLRWSWLGWLGTIAYGVYLFHSLFLGAFNLMFWSSPVATMDRISHLLTTLSALVATLVFCRLSWRYFEKPLIDLGHRTRYLS